jgi:hypothetical protein
MIDNHALEIKAMECFISGNSKEAHRLQDEFLDEVRKSGEDHCSCKSQCKHHGNCVECVIIHRGHGGHLPNCFRDMVNVRIQAISELSEHTFVKSE